MYERRQSGRRGLCPHLVALAAGTALVLASVGAGGVPAAAAGTASFCCNSAGDGYNLAVGIEPSPAVAGQTVRAIASVSPAVSGGTATFELGSPCQFFCQNQPAPSTSLGSCTLKVVSMSGTSDGECSVSFTAGAPGKQGVYVRWTTPGGSQVLATEINLTVAPGSGASSGGGTGSGGAASSSGSYGSAGGSGLGGPSGSASSPSPFADLGGVPWAAPQIAFLHAQGVVAGVSSTAFDPGGPLTAQAAVTLLARLFLPAGSAGPATPLPGVAGWAQAAVDWAEGHGVIRGAGSFAAGRPAPRAQVAAWVVRALGLSCQCSPAADLRFADARSIPSAYRQEDTVAEVDGLFEGGPHGNLHPAEPVTRAQMAVVLVRAEEALAERGAAATPLTWTLSASQPSQTSATWQGSATVGTATPPVGSIEGGKLSLHGSGGSLSESFLRWGSSGAATVQGSMGGQPGAVQLVWRAGRIWGTPSAGSGVETYSGSTAGGSLSFQASSSCGSGCSESASGTYQITLLGGAETARSCSGASSQCLQYRGPALPGPVLIDTGQFVTALFLAGSTGSNGSPSSTGPTGTSAAAASSPDPVVVAHDEAAVAAENGQCAAFSPSGCPFGPAVTTSDGSGGALYAVWLKQETGDACYEGMVYFFDGERAVGDTSKLPPDSIGGVVGVRPGGPQKFAVDYGVSPSAHASCAANGSAGTMTWLYGWTGTKMFAVSGNQPPAPEVIVGSPQDR